MTNVSQPTVQIDGTTMEEIMMKDMGKSMKIGKRRSVNI